jgi:hypothetical protein
VHLSLRLLVLLIAASPAIVFVDDAMTWGFVTALTAAAIVMIALNVASTEAAYLSALFRPIAIALAIPALWMLIQIIPMPFGSLAHPIWVSAATAVNKPMFGRISVDPGATLLSISRYLCATGIIFAAAATTVDRWRAEWMLFSLVAVTSVMAPIYLVYSLGGFEIFGVTYDLEHASVMSAVSVLATIITAAAAIRAFERFEARRSGQEIVLRRFWSNFAIWLGAWSISWFVIAGRASHIFAAACGTASVAIIEVIRRLGINRRVSAAIAATAVAVAIAVIAIQPSGQSDVTLRFAASATSPGVPMTEQMLMDTHWTGAGAGAFSALAPIYQNINDPDAATAPTTAAAIAIELGRPALVFVLSMMIAAAVLLGAGALRRGRDSFYSAAGAGCVVALAIEMFTDATALSTTIQIISATIIGLGLAQSKSRSRQ